MPPREGRTVDPVLFEVIRNALVEATEEMSVTLQRTAYSTNIKTRLDYSCAFVDAAGRMVAQAFCQPAHLVTIGRLVPRAVAEYADEHGGATLGPGDALLVNDPHRQASHLNDVFLISPFFHEGELVGYVANCCHHVDVGGRRASQHRSVPRDLPGGDHPSRRQAVHRRRTRGRRAQALPRQRAREEGGGGRPESAVRRERNRVATAVRAVEALRRGDPARLHRAHDRVQRAATSRRVGGPPARRVRGGGVARRRRNHRRARSPQGPDPVRWFVRPVRLHGHGRAARRPDELQPHTVLHGLRLRAEVSGRPRHPAERGVLSPDRGGRARGIGGQREATRRGGRRGGKWRCGSAT